MVHQRPSTKQKCFQAFKNFKGFSFSKSQTASPVIFTMSGIGAAQISKAWGPRHLGGTPVGRKRFGRKLVECITKLLVYKVRVQCKSKISMLRILGVADSCPAVNGRFALCSWLPCSLKDRRTMGWNADFFSVWSHWPLVSLVLAEDQVAKWKREGACWSLESFAPFCGDLRFLLWGVISEKEMEERECFDAAIWYLSRLSHGEISENANEVWKPDLRWQELLHIIKHGMEHSELLLKKEVTGEWLG